ncbi:glycosyltransferase [Podospora conica]|nr:glycosyltransferase [Schizothecium conicum]
MRGHRQDALTRPYHTLVASFAAWKLFLLAIAIGSCVGDAYDTSGSLAVLGNDGHPPGFGASLVTRFASWDAIYFLTAARRGYRFEQEWAFGAPLAITIHAIIRALSHLGLVTRDPQLGPGDDNGSALLETVVAIFVANTSHLLSAIVLYRLGLVVWRSNPRGPLLSLVAALLHVVSPAGLFLSAPYAESTCALLTFLGYLLYARSCTSQTAAARDGYVVLAGLAFGLATSFRSNAILNGIPFAWEVLQVLSALAGRWTSGSTSARLSRSDPQSTTPTTGDAVRRLLALGAGGVAVAAGTLVPQAVAYQRFCVSPSDADLPRRPWCDKLVPSIYTFVQQHYWDNGFLRYWTLPNVPLFLLAAPVLAIMVKSGIDHLGPPAAQKRPGPAGPGSTEGGSARLSTMVRSAAAAQAALAVLATLNHHVQIITRISSGYPVWYWWVADKVVRGDAWGKRIVVFMVMYAGIQGALFTSFLPPA